MITFLFRHYLLHQEKQRENKKNNSRVSRRTSADWRSRVKRKKQRIPGVGCSLWPHCPTAVLHDSVAIETAVKKGRRWRAKRARPLLFLLDGWRASRSFCGFGRGARHRQPWPSFVWQAPAASASACLPHKITGSGNRRDWWAVWAGPSVVRVRRLLLFTHTHWLTHRPPAHRPLCHAWRAWPSIRGANTVEIQLKKVDMSSVFFFIQMVGQCLFPL